MDRFLAFLAVVAGAIGLHQTGVLGWIYRTLLWIINHLSQWRAGF